MHGHPARNHEARAARLLSLGQRMRCDLGATLLHGPAILYLDEPTIGLDVAVKQRVRQFLKRINRERDITILLTSHDIGDIEDVCRRVVMIDAGKLVYDGDFAALRERFARQRVIRLTLRGPLDDVVDRATTALAGLPSARVEQTDPYRLAVEFDLTRATAVEVAGCLLPVLPVADFQIDEPSTESVIRRLYEGELTLDGAGTRRSETD